MNESIEEFPNDESKINMQWLFAEIWTGGLFEAVIDRFYFMTRFNKEIWGLERIKQNIEKTTSIS